MLEPHAAPAHRAQPHSLARLLLMVWALVIVYASLYPFEGWRLPPGPSALSLLALPWPFWRDRFDEAANLLGYAPFGALACVLLLRRGHAKVHAVALTAAAAATLSYGVELAQTLLPVRVPSLKDSAFNVMGAMSGAAAVAVLHGTDLTVRLHAHRQRWFGRQAAVGLGLLLLWPWALLFPAPVPLGLGHGWAWATDWLREALAGTALESWRIVPEAGVPPAVATLAPVHELTIVALGLMAPCLVAYAATLRAHRRVVLMVGAALFAAGVTTLSVTLSFGPEHAFAWVTPNVTMGFATGLVLSVFSLALSQRAAAVFGVIVLLALLWAVAHAPTDPYYAQNLSEWERGRFIHFHGLARWIGWLWPYAAAIWLAVQAVARPAAGASKPTILQ